MQTNKKEKNIPVNRIAIYYFHPLDFTFTSAQTIQVIKDYTYLSKLGFPVFLYGLYKNKEHLREILNYIQNSQVFIEYKQQNILSKILRTSSFFLKKITLSKYPYKLIVIRDVGYKKLEKIFLFKKIFKQNIRLLIEFHENAFPHLTKKNLKLKSKFKNAIQKANGIIFTNYSQVVLYRKEFGDVPNTFIILPNGVDIEKFSNIRKNPNQNHKILTYTGQFSSWKNIELMFAALSVLPQNIILKIAGGKGDNISRKLIHDLAKKYCLESRVNYLGYIPHSKIPNVLNCSDVLLLPLGNNVQSKFLTCPIKLFEYMSTGIPIVSVNYPSISMIAGECIFLSENNPTSFANAIKEALYNKVADHKAKKAKEIAKQYSYENRAKKYSEFIQMLFQNE